MYQIDSVYLIQDSVLNLSLGVYVSHTLCKCSESL